MTQNLFLSSLKFIIRDLIGDVIYFPIWWYTKGVKNVAFFCFKEIKEASRRLAIPILFSHLLKPMYGQYDIAGRIISFFFRMIQFFWNMLFMLTWLIIMILVFFFWLSLPIITVWQIILNFSILK